MIFVTTVFGRGENGPETYARYLWEAFGDDPDFDFHVVAPEFAGEHPRWHAAGRGAGSLELYARTARKALQTAEQFAASGSRPLMHVNSSHLHHSLLGYRGLLWGQVNDYENADLWRRAGETLGRAGLRRFLALWRRRRLERRFLARQDLSLCNSDFTRSKILEEYNPPHPERIITLHKAVDVSFFARPSLLPSDPLGRPAAARRLIFVGSDFRRKGLDILLQAVRQLPNSLDWHLSIVGPSKEQVMAAFPALEIGSLDARVLFAGRLDKEQLRAVLWNSDIFALPSRAEAFGVALLESLAAGLPVVSCAVGGIPEIVSHPDAGLLVPPDDAAALARALECISPWPAGTQPVAVREILQKFSAQRMTGELRQRYLAMLASAGRAL